MKKWKIAGVVVLCVVVGLIVFLRYFAGATIKQAVNTAGPAVLGVPVEVQDVKLNPFTGHLSLRGLHVGNPEGFKTDGIFDLDLLEVNLKLSSLFKETIYIKNITIKDPIITLERGLTKSNIGALLDNLEGEDDTKKDASKEKKAKSKKDAKKVVIEEFHLNGARLNLSVSAMQGVSAPIPLPPIVLYNLGKKTDGASFIEVLSDVFKSILSTATEAAIGAGKWVLDGAKAVGDAAVDSAKAVGGAAVDGAKTVGGAVVDGAGSVVKGVGKLFGGDEKDDGKKDEE